MKIYHRIVEFPKRSQFYAHLKFTGSNWRNYYTLLLGDIKGHKVEYKLGDPEAINYLTYGKTYIFQISLDNINRVVYDTKDKKLLIKLKKGELLW